MAPHALDRTLVTLGQRRDSDPHVESLTDHGFTRRRSGRIAMIDGEVPHVFSFDHGPPRCHTPGRITKTGEPCGAVEKYLSRRIERDDRRRRRREELAVLSAADRPVLVPASKERADVFQGKPLDLQEA